MHEKASKILDILEGVPTSQAQEILADVVQEFDLTVASNIIRAGHEPKYMTKSFLADDLYSEGNDSAGHVPVLALLKEVQSIVNLDTDESESIEFTKSFVRRYSQHELELEDKVGDGIEWYKEDKKQPVKGVLVGFNFK